MSGMVHAKLCHLVYDQRKVQDFFLRHFYSNAAWRLIPSSLEKCEECGNREISVADYNVGYVAVYVEEMLGSTPRKIATSHLQL